MRTCTCVVHMCVYLYLYFYAHTPTCCDAHSHTYTRDSVRACVCVGVRTCESMCVRRVHCVSVTQGIKKEEGERHESVSSEHTRS